MLTEAVDRAVSGVALPIMSIIHDKIAVPSFLSCVHKVASWLFVAFASLAVWQLACHDPNLDPLFCLIELEF